MSEDSPMGQVGPGDPPAAQGSSANLSDLSSVNAKPIVSFAAAVAQPPLEPEKDEKGMYILHELRLRVERGKNREVNLKDVIVELDRKAGRSIRIVRPVANSHGLYQAFFLKKEARDEMGGATLTIRDVHLTCTVYPPPNIPPPVKIVHTSYRLKNVPAELTLAVLEKAITDAFGLTPIAGHTRFETYASARHICTGNVSFALPGIQVGLKFLNLHVEGYDVPVENVDYELAPEQMTGVKLTSADVKPLFTLAPQQGPPAAPAPTTAQVSKPKPQQPKNEGAKAQAPGADKKADEAKAGKAKADDAKPEAKEPATAPITTANSNNAKRTRENDPTQVADQMAIDGASENLAAEEADEEDDDEGAFTTVSKRRKKGKDKITDASKTMSPSSDATAADTSAASSAPTPSTTPASTNKATSSSAPATVPARTTGGSNGGTHKAKKKKQARLPFGMMPLVYYNMTSGGRAASSSAPPSSK